MVQSVLATYLLERMAWGFLSPQEVKTLASLAKQDIEMSATSPQPLDELTRLAAAGSYGAHPNKCFSDIMKKHGGDNKLPKAHPFKLPLKGHADDVLQAMILPHELFYDLQSLSRYLVLVQEYSSRQRHGQRGKFLDCS